MKRQGQFINNLAGYRSFKPSNLRDVEKQLRYDDEINNLVISIHENLVKINTMSELIQDSDLFLYAYVYQEALESSRIEGTECTMEDIFLNINNDKPGNVKNIDDIRETISNIKAIDVGVEKLNKLPLCTRFFKELHEILLNNARGENKNPGEIRTTQNWIGGNSIKDATFIPPNVEDMKESLKELDEYINDESTTVDKIIKTALIHYQFETIHPFLDGNGRLGRIIILLYLVQEKLLSKPNVYMSYFLKIHQLEYYSKLMEVRLNDKYEEYIKFFSQCLNETTKSVINKINNLDELHKRNLSRLPIVNREKNNYKIVFNYIERNPIFSIGLIQNASHLSFNTVNTVVCKLEELGIVKKITDIKRNKVYAYDEYFKLFASVK
jgi:Fic family protein